MFRLVIVDDESAVVEGLKNALDWEGFQIEIPCATTDPFEALDYVQDHQVQIVITDVSMPGMTGLELIHRIKEQKPSVYIIILSAYDNFEYVRTALRYGAENYLLKPLDPESLSDTISQIIHNLEEREILQNNYGRTMLTFRSAFTQQWVAGYLSASELESRAQLLGIDLTAEGITVLIFEGGEPSGAEMSRFFELLLRFLPGHFTASFYFETPQRLVCVLSPVDGTQPETVDFVHGVMEQIAADSLPIGVSIGPTVASPDEVPSSYRQACKEEPGDISAHMDMSDRERSPLVESVLSIIREGDDRDISLKTLAARYRVSPAYLGTIFRQQTGWYFNDYLAEARLTRAAGLLKDTDLKVREIVDRTGFSSQTYFNRSFKRRFGVSPLSYRRGS